MCDMGLFKGRSLEAKLEYAYAHFRQWCHATHQSCKINEFSKKQLKIPTGQLDRVLGVLFARVRRSMYPVLGGQGHDCIVVHKWLSVVLHEFDLNDLVPCPHPDRVRIRRAGL